jgi:NH3-dependent NAD+ synthetase
MVHFGTDIRCPNWFQSLAGKFASVRIGEGGLTTPAEQDDRRWARALGMARRQDRALIGSSTRTELVSGLYSLSSRLPIIQPLAGVWKTDVMRLCQLIDMPEEMVDSSRNPDPDCGRPPQITEIGLEDIDIFLRVRVGELPETALARLDKGQVGYLDRIYESNRFKRDLPVLGPQLPASAIVAVALPSAEGTRRSGSLADDSRGNKFHRPDKFKGKQSGKN